MDKPTPKQREPLLDFFECQKFIEDKLGYDIRDVLGRHKNDMTSREEVEYWDYWHFLIDNISIHNGCVISIPYGLLECGTDWQNKITQAFLDEFGEAEYWVEW